MMNKLSLVLAVSVVSFRLSFGLFVKSEPYGHLLPHDPYSVEGENLTLTCKLTKHGEKKMLHTNLQFKINDSYLPNETLQIIANLTATVTLSNISLDLDGKIIQCYNDKTLISEQYIKICSKEPPATDFHCILHYVSSFDMSLVCLWTNFTQSSFMWTDDCYYNYCIALESSGYTSRCKWHYIKRDQFDSFYPMQRLYFQIQEKRCKKVFQMESTFYPLHVVKPAVVDSVKVLCNSNTNATVTWSHLGKQYHVAENRSLVYMYCVNVTSIYGTLPCQNLVKNKTLLLLTDLHPATLYTLNIAVRPSYGGYWSDPTQMSFHTQEAAPSSPPVITQGSWIIKSITKNNNRIIYLFWQAIKKSERNGVIKKYIFKVYNHQKFVEQYKWNSTINNKKLNKLRVTGLHVYMSYEITIQGETSKGLSPEAIYRIPRQDHVTSKERDNVKFVLLTNSIVKIEWRYTGQDNTTVYWRYQTEWKWVTLNRSQYHYLYKVPNSHELEDYRFGVSTQKNGLSNGMSIEYGRCIFPPNAKPIMPLMNADIDSARSGLTYLVLFWDKPDCYRMKASITGYRVEFFRLPHTSQSVCPGNGKCTKVLLVNESEDTSVKITKLWQNTRYCFRVAAVANGGHGPFSQWKLSKTELLSTKHLSVKENYNFPEWLIVTIVAVVIVSTVFCLFGVRKLYTFLKWYNTPERIDVPNVKSYKSQKNPSSGFVIQSKYSRYYKGEAVSMTDSDDMTNKEKRSRADSGISTDCTSSTSKSVLHSDSCRSSIGFSSMPSIVESVMEALRLQDQENNEAESLLDEYESSTSGGSSCKSIKGLKSLEENVQYITDTNKVVAPSFQGYVPHPSITTITVPSMSEEQMKVFTFPIQEMELHTDESEGGSCEKLILKPLEGNAQYITDINKVLASSFDGYVSHPKTGIMPSMCELQKLQDQENNEAESNEPTKSEASSSEEYIKPLEGNAQYITDTNQVIAPSFDGHVPHSSTTTCNYIDHNMVIGHTPTDQC